jgi:drug/metabolite transporter (DMT)-like permease
MDRRSFLLFIAVGVLFGAPYLLTKVAVAEVAPIAVALARTAIAAVVLTLVVGPRRVLRAVRARPRAVAALGALQFAVPFALVAWAAQHLDSSLVGVLIATEPLLVALLAVVLDARERADARGAAGMLVGLAGVGLLLGVDVDGTAAGLVAAAAVLLAAGCYSAAALLLPRLAGAGTDRLGLLTAALWATAVALLPWTLADPPARVPGPDAVAGLVALGILCTAVAFPLWFALIARAGAARAALVTYVNPVVALALGAAVLAEPVTPTALGGLALILAGTWTGTRPPHRAPVPPAMSGARPGTL